MSTKPERRSSPKAVALADRFGPDKRSIPPAKETPKVSYPKTGIMLSPEERTARAVESLASDMRSIVVHVRELQTESDDTRKTLNTLTKKVDETNRLVSKFAKDLLLIDARQSKLEESHAELENRVAKLEYGQSPGNGSSGSHRAVVG